jgi:hypothetical protein
VVTAVAIGLELIFTLIIYHFRMTPENYDGASWFTLYTPNPDSAWVLPKFGEVEFSGMTYYGNAWPFVIMTPGLIVVLVVFTRLLIITVRWTLGLDHGRHRAQ